eukprot:Sdes_comp20489_c0_seq5m14902
MPPHWASRPAAGAFPAAAKHDLIIVCPDTSPRGAKIAGESDSYDFGEGAGFYLDATREPWKKHYKMYSFVIKELISLLERSFCVDIKNLSISGHSMGGHGALLCALKNPGLFRSVSCFAPICNPKNCPWGQKAFQGYLSEKNEASAYDSCDLASLYDGVKLNILIDQVRIKSLLSFCFFHLCSNVPAAICFQGTKDQFYLQKQLLPENFSSACSKNKQHLSLELRFQEGYDHSYYFINSFIEDHINFHRKNLQLTKGSAS